MFGRRSQLDLEATETIRVPRNLNLEPGQIVVHQGRRCEVVGKIQPVEEPRQGPTFAEVAELSLRHAEMLYSHRAQMAETVSRHEQEMARLRSLDRRAAMEHRERMADKQIELAYIHRAAGWGPPPPLISPEARELDWGPIPTVVAEAFSIQAPASVLDFGPLGVAP